MTRADVAAMLRAAQMHHINEHVTGMLLQAGDTFLHYFEGPKAKVQPVADRLKNDSRFAGVVTLAEGPLTRRLYPHWSLAFQEITGPTTRLGALNGMLERALTSDPDELRAAAGSEALLHRLWTEYAAGLPR